MFCQAALVADYCQAMAEAVVPLSSLLPAELQ
jgi:hypothetical protein